MRARASSSSPILSSMPWSVGATCKADCRCLVSILTVSLRRDSFDLLLRPAAAITLGRGPLDVVRVFLARARVHEAPARAGGRILLPALGAVRLVAAAGAL